MKLMFNKNDYNGHWFYDDEDTEGYTEKVPLNTGYIFDEDLNDWVLKPEPEPEIEPEEQEASGNETTEQV
jgi:hypothetical protein